MTVPRFIRITNGSPEYGAQCALRHEVLREPLGLSLYDEDLDAEMHHLHFGLFGPSQGIVACVQAVPISATEAQLKQMAVKPTHQGQGLGRQIILAAEKVLINEGFQRVTLHARSHVVDFYQRQGYLTEGAEFLEVGIPHRKMFKTLHPA